MEPNKDTCEVNLHLNKLYQMDIETYVEEIWGYFLGKFECIKPACNWSKCAHTQHASFKFHWYRTVMYISFHSDTGEIK